MKDARESWDWARREDCSCGGEENREHGETEESFPKEERSPHRPVRDLDEEKEITSASFRVSDWIKGKTGRRIIVGLGLAGILLIGISSLIPKKEDDTQAQREAASQSTAEFVAATEQKLADIIGSVAGAGTCRVMVTLENGVEYVYASEQKTNTDRKEDSDSVSQKDDSEKSVIVVDSGDGKQGLLVTEIQPTVKGVVVVCEGGDKTVVQQQIVTLVTTVLNISSKRVCVTKMSG